MQRLVRRFRTTVGRKLIVATTGVALLGFLLAHLAGNLTLYQGSDALNAYAGWLQDHPLLWVARIGLLTVFIVHMAAALSLARENAGARPSPYATRSFLRAGLASRYIVVTGSLVLAFLLFHLAHFTFGWVGDSGAVASSAAPKDVYGMVVSAFQRPAIAAGYVVAMLVLGLHLHHGIEGFLRTLGIHHEYYESVARIATQSLVAILVIGNCSFPLLISLGLVAGD